MGHVADGLGKLMPSGDFWWFFWTMCAFAVFTLGAILFFWFVLMPLP